MNPTRLRALALTALTTVLASASAQTAQTQAATSVATGSSTGTYSALMRDMNRTCGAGLWREQGTTGSIENVSLLLSGKVNTAFVQFDVMRARLQLDGDSGVADLRTLLPLHREEVHFFTRAGEAATTAAQLQGRKIGAWGGSVLTTRLIAQNASLGYQVVKFENRDEAFAALAAGRVDGVLAVIGQPAAWVSELKDVKLIAVPMKGAMTQTYRTSKLNYPQVPGGTSQTVSVQSLLVVNPGAPGFDMATALKTQSCVQQKLSALRSDAQAHPKWKDIRLTLSLSPWKVLQAPKP